MVTNFRTLISRRDNLNILVPFQIVLQWLM